MPPAEPRYDDTEDAKGLDGKGRGGAPAGVHLYTLNKADMCLEVMDVLL